VRVTFLADYYHPFEIGGAERSAERLAIELGRTGAAVIVVTPNYGAEPTEQVHGVDVIRLPFPQRLLPGQLARRMWLSNPALHAFYAFRLARLLRGNRSTLLHVQNSTLLLAGVLAGRMARIPVVVTVRDLAYLAPERQDEDAGARGWRAVKWLLDAIWARAERRLKRAALVSVAEVVFVSRALLELYATRGLDRVAAKAHVVYNIGPGHAPTNATTRDPLLVLFVGKLSEGKGLRVLYRAAERVMEALPRVRFVLAGSPGVGFTPPPPAVAPLFSLTGRLTAHAVEGLMERASVLVAPAVWPEPLSRVLLEAMSAGLPVVATTVGGNREALEHGKSGWLVPPNDVDALADGMLRLLTDPSVAARLAEGARERFMQLFSPEAILPRILAVYGYACGRQ
jgi:glycosyltransferase involved in cell wall biosynthesis